MNRPTTFQRQILAGVCAFLTLAASAWATPVQNAFLRLMTPRQELTVGELIPVKIKACFPAGMSVSLNGPPTLSGGAFALNKVGDNPEQMREVIDGQSYNVITWSSTLSAVQAGDYPLNLELPVTVRVQEKDLRTGRNPFKDFFGDTSPFDDTLVDDFFGHVTEKSLTLHSDNASLKIRPLPLQGRPTNFSGAVGKFDLNAEVSMTKAVIGDPITLKLKITGLGNFDRVNTNGLSANAVWKSYKPSAQFESTDHDGLGGTKTFEQTIVPTQAGPSEIPALNFSYFDPDTLSYVTRTTSSIPVEIVPGSATAAAAASVPAASAAAPDTRATSHAVGQPAPGYSAVGQASSLQPVMLAPWFLITNVLLATVTASGLLIRRWRNRRASDPRRARAAAAGVAVREAVSLMDEAIKNRDGVGFFHAARQAVTERLAERWSVPVKLVTAAEIRARLDGGGEKICALFKRGDEVAYSRENVAASELTEWRANIAQQLANL